MKNILVKIIENIKLNDDYFLLWIHAPEISKSISSGQFFEIKIAGNNFPLLRKPISVFEVKNENVGFMIKKIGRGTENFSHLKKNDVLDIIGPLGNSFELPSQKEVLLISGGIGYAPLHNLKKELLSNNNNVTWIHGGRSTNDIFSSDFTFTDDGSSGQKGFVTIGMEEILLKKKFDLIYCCGPKIMMKKCSEIAKKFHTKMFVSLEEYMACGIGVCHGCAVAIKKNDSFTYKTVCKDGPIFNSNEVIWNE